MIVGERVRHARELAGTTQTSLADAIGVSQSAITHIESGLLQPSSAVVAAITRETGFPVRFFEHPPHRDFSYGSLLFRRHKTGTARDEKRAIRMGQVIDELFLAFSSRLKPVPVLLPRLDYSEHTLEEAAALVRSALGIPLGEPIEKLVSAVERGGVVVYATPVDLPKQQAFSLWAGPRLERPVIAVVRGQPGDRLRWSISHELGHLVLHPAPIAGIDIEKDANRFASEFLLPQDIFRAEVTGPVTLMTLHRLKQRWKVSMQTIAMRCRDLGVITERQARYLFQQISARGWRTSEPEAIPAEQPRALRQMAEMLYGKPIDYARLADEQALPPMLVRQIFEDLVGPVEGQRHDGGSGEVVNLNQWAARRAADPTARP